MIRVRLFFAAAGVLLMSDAAQAEADVRLSSSTENANFYFQKAYDSNQEALDLITTLPFRYEVYRKSEKDSLSRAQKDLEKLIAGKSEYPSTTSTWALFWQAGARFSKESFEDPTKCEKCNQTSTIMQRAIAYTITAIKKEPTLESFRIQVEELTKDFIFENGTIKSGVSEDNIYELGWNVTDIIGGDYPFQ